MGWEQSLRPIEQEADGAAEEPARGCAGEGFLTGYSRIRTGILILIGVNPARPAVRISSVNSRGSVVVTSTSADSPVPIRRRAGRIVA